MATGLEKVSFHSNPKERQCQECSNYCITALISHASKVMLKIFQARLQQYKNRELADTQAGFRKGRWTRDQIANIHWITEKAREFLKNRDFCFIDYAKAFDCVDHNELWKILKRDGNTRPPHNWATSLSLFSFMHWRRKWQHTPVFLPGEAQGRGSLLGCRLWGHTESDTTEATSSSSSLCRTRSNWKNCTWNNRLVPNRERSMSRLYVVTLLI